MRNWMPKARQDPPPTTETEKVLPDFGANGTLVGGLPMPTDSDTPLLDAAYVGLDCAADGDPDQQNAPSPTAAGNAPSTKADALTAHGASVRLVDAMLRSARAQEVGPEEDDASRVVLLHNSVQWIDSGRIGLKVLDQTHDSAQRAPVGKMACFDTRVAWNSTAADYDEADVRNNAGISLIFPEGGHFDPSANEIVFVSPAEAGVNAVVNTLIHEVQHACDGGPNGVFDQDLQKPGTGPYAAPAWAYAAYASEYRARMVDPKGRDFFGDPTKAPQEQETLTATRDPTDPDVVSGVLGLSSVTSTGFANEQQRLVFQDMVRDRSITNWYDFAADDWLAIYGYFPHYYVLDVGFRIFVDALGAAGPVSGGNEVNSVRIEVLAEGIQQGRGNADIVEATKALDSVDRCFLQDTARSDPFWGAAKQALASRMPLYTRISTIVNARAATDPLGDRQAYTVVAGDTLYTIAARTMGTSSAWHDLALANPTVDPRHLVVGSTLVIPE